MESRLESQLQNYRVIRNRNINLLSLLKSLARCKLKFRDLSPYKNVTSSFVTRGDESSQESYEEISS